MKLDFPLHCNVCHTLVMEPCARAANDNCGIIPCIEVAADWQLRRPSHYRRLAMVVSAIPLSRRKMMDDIASEVYGYQGIILWPDGRPFVVMDEDIDNAFGSDGRFISSFIQDATRLPKQKTQTRVVPALRLLDIYVRLRSPKVARHLTR